MTTQHFTQDELDVLKDLKSRADNQIDKICELEKGTYAQSWEFESPDTILIRYSLWDYVETFWVPESFLLQPIDKLGDLLDELAVKRDKEARAEQERLHKLLDIRQREKDLAELARLRALYGDEQ